MKKNYFAVFGVLTAVFCCYLSASYFDFCNFKNYLLTVSPDVQAEMIVVPSDISGISEDDFIDELRKEASNVQLNVFQSVPYNQGDFERSNDMISFVCFGDQKTEHSLLLQNGSEVDLTNFTYYMTHSPDKRHRLFTAVDDTIYGICAIDKTMENMGYDPFGSYTLSCSDSENLRGKVELFTDSLSMKFEGNLLIQYTLLESHEHVDFQRYFISVHQTVIVSFIILTFMISILFISDIVGRQKELSVMKLEGRSIWNIYYHTVLKSYARFFMCLVFVMALLTLMFVRISFTKALDYYACLVSSVTISSFLMLVFAAVFLAVIQRVPANLAVKGRDFNREMKHVLQIIKVVLLVVSSDVMISGLPSMYQFAKNYLDFSGRFKAYEEVYVFLSSSSSAQERTPEQVFDTLYKQNNLFCFYNYSAVFQRPVFLVDRNYLALNEEEKERMLDSRKLLILFPGTMKNVTENERIAYDLAMTYLPGTSLEEAKKICSIFNYDDLMNYDYQMSTSSSNSFSHVSKKICTEILLCDLSMGEYKELSTNMYFYYKGNLQEAKDYLNELFDKYSGSECHWRIAEAQQLYRDSYMKKQTNFLKNIGLFVFWIIAYLLLCSQIVREDFLENKQVYQIEKTEGITYGFFYKDYLLGSLITILASFAGTLFLRNSPRIHLAVLFSFLIVLEGIFSWLYHEKRKSNFIGEEK